MASGRTGKDTDIEYSLNTKHPYRVFFKSGWSNLIRLMAVNALYLIFNVPAIIWSYFFAIVFVPVLAPVMHWDSFITIMSENGNTEVSYQLYMLLVIFFVNALVASGLMSIGPFQAGFAQVYKGIRDGSSCSLFTDFKTGMKENWKRSLVTMVIGIVITAILLLAVSFYLNLGGYLGIIIGCVFGILFFAFILVQNFVYQMMVSTDLKLGKIYKNAILFVLLRFGPCLGVALVVILFFFIIPFVLLMSASYLTLGLFLFLYSFVVIAWVQYYLSFFTGRLIDKYVTVGKKDDLSPDNELELNSEEDENPD